jgi:hypothetical protein
MYDWYLDPNGGLFGLHKGSEPLHIMYNPVNHMIMAVNNTYEFCRDVMVLAYTIDQEGAITPIYKQMADVEPASIKNCQSIGRGVTSRSSENGVFLVLKLLRSEEEILSENIYWLPDSAGNYTFLQNLPGTNVKAEAKKMGNSQIKLIITNPPENYLAFFIRVSLVDLKTGNRVLPVFYSDNYISIEPENEKLIFIDYPENTDLNNAVIRIEGWNVASMDVKVE